jgi:hypothetical protein
MDGSVEQIHASAALSPEKDHSYQLNIRQGGFWELSGLFGEETNLSFCQPLLKFEARLPGCPASITVVIQTIILLSCTEDTALTSSTKA